MKRTLAWVLALLLALTGAVAVSASEDLEPVELKIWFHGSNVADDTAVLEKVNEYLTEKINVTLRPIWGTWGDFDDTVVQAINAGDDVDIYFTSAWSKDDYTLYAKRGAWVRLDDPENNLIEQYASDLWALLPQVLIDGAHINGSDGYGVYAVPGYKDIATQNCWDVNVTMLEKYGYTIDDIKNTDYYGFGDIFAKVKEGEGDAFYPLLMEGAVLERMVTSAIILTGDSTDTALMSYYINPEDTAAEGPYGNVIFNKFATDEYKKFVEKTREYYEAGYINPAMGMKDLANETRTNTQLQGQYLIGTQSYALGYEHEASQQRQIEVAMVPVTPAYVDTTSSQGAMMAVSTASKNPERALMFLNLLNTEPELMTMLNYGIEGIHYNLVDGLVDFIPEARDKYSPWRNGMGNITLLPPTVGEGEGFWDEFKAYYSVAGEIPILGFAFDPDPVKNEMAALVNLGAEYSLPLSVGSVDPAEKLPEFLEKLEAAGMQKVLDEANAQLAAFLEGKE